MAGKFITFEGGEGVGKTTQIKRLASLLEAKGVRYHITREPGGSEGGEEIRRLILTGDAGRWTPMTEALLMTASRVDHVEKVVKPMLADGVVVLCDRFFDSSIAYQGAGHGLGTEKVRALQTLALGDFKPDMTLILHSKTSEGLERAVMREGQQDLPEDRFERMGDAFHARVKAAFLAMAPSDPRFCMIDADGTVDDVTARIWPHVANLLSLPHAA